jgi:hypothetical protein
MAVDYETGNLYLNGGKAAYDAEGRMFARNDSIPYSEGMAYFAGRLVVSKASSYWDRNPLRKVTLLTLYSPGLKPEGTIDVPDKGPNTTTFNVEGGIVEVDFISDIVSNNGERLIVKEGRSDTVFYYTGEPSLRPAYRLAMGRFTIPDEVLDGSLGYNVNGHCAIVDIIEGSRYIFVTTWELGKWVPVYLVFDGRDYTDGFMAAGPNGRTGIFLDGLAFTPRYIRDNRLVGYMQAFDMVDNAAAITNPDLKALAATLKEDDNPVIIVATLKK